LEVEIVIFFSNFELKIKNFISGEAVNAKISNVPEAVGVFQIIPKNKSLLINYVLTLAFIYEFVKS